MHPIKIERIERNGPKSKDEVLWLRASSSVELSNYAIVDRTFNADGELSNKFRHIYRFPKKRVNAGDWIMLCTGRGTNNSDRTKDVNKIHEFYWNSDICVWNQKEDAVILIYYEVVDTTPVKS